jgi:hypothetical protein
LYALCAHCVLVESVLTFLRVLKKNVHTFFEGPQKVCTYFLRVFEKCAHICLAFSAVCTEIFGLSPCCALLLLQSAQVFDG